jgi:chemotaxis protein MotB
MAARRPSKHPEKDNSERWLLTYSDLITLLLIYFIVLFSMSSVNAEKFSELSKSLAIIFSGQVGRSGVLDGGRSVIPGKQNLNPNKHMMNTEEKIKRLIQQMGLQGKITTSQQMRGLVISVKDTVLFRQGSADMDSRAHDVVTEVGKILKDIPNSIRIEGHTDNVPIHTIKYYSNWELSTARATNVLHYLIESSGISPERLSAAGYGEFRPVVTNENDSGKAINRRVDIVVLNEEFEKFEPQVNSENQPEKSSSVPDSLPMRIKEILQSNGVNIRDTLDTSL